MSFISMPFGTSGRFECSVATARTSVRHAAPAAIVDLRLAIRSALRSPLDYPPLDQTVLPDDRVALALDRWTPCARLLIAEVCQILGQAGVRPENITIVQPMALDAEPAETPDPRGELPPDTLQQIHWRTHNPSDESQSNYLASTTAGERVYLSKDLIESDVVVSIGEVAYDPLMGFRGTNSVFYPGMSTRSAMDRAHGQGHRELSPDDDRPLRQLVDEVGWLLGTQFTLQVVAAAGTGVSAVFAGAGDSVFRRARQFVADQWSISLSARPDIVMLAIDQDAAGHGWQQVGAALATARNLVRRGGKIVVLTELDAPLGPGLEMLQAAGNPRDALRPLRSESPADLLPATQLAIAADWANVYLLSQLPGDVVEDLFMIPLENTQEAQRLLNGEETCAFIASAQHVYGAIQSA